MPGWKKNIPACLQADQEGGLKPIKTFQLSEVRSTSRQMCFERYASEKDVLIRSVSHGLKNVRYGKKHACFPHSREPFQLSEEM
ncbi:uncharacterized [Tachysurus ichikawai]